MPLYQVSVDHQISFEQAWQEFEERGMTILYGEEEEKENKFFIELADPQQINHCHFVKQCVETTLPAIDWESQWEIHGHDFHHGFVHVALPNAKELKLQPGPGFGDLSHPTTILMMDMLKVHLLDQKVIDIGCGSGILSITAALLGAKEVFGIDIDKEALNHSRINAEINQVQKICHFIEPSDYVQQKNADFSLILMNMIQSEQLIAWESLPFLHSNQGLILTSGICKEDQEIYLSQTKEWNWKLLESKELDGWMSFSFHH